MELTMGERRQFRGLTQTELAEKIGLPPGENGRIRISQYENGTHTPKEEILEKISNALGVTSKYLSVENSHPALDFVFHMLEYDRDDPVLIEKVGQDRYSLEFDCFIVSEFMDEWIQKKADLKTGKISKDEYTEWTINLE